MLISAEAYAQISARLKVSQNYYERPLQRAENVARPVSPVE